MPRTNKDIISLLRIVLTDHKSHWEAQMGELKRYKNAYENRFWEGESTSDQMIRVETADCFSYVEGFIAALFSKAPAVVVGADAANAAGDPDLAQAAVNRFLFSQREQLEIASRLALIYPNSFLKLSPIRLLIDEARIQGSLENYKYFNLGGGLGNQIDSLFHFKASFSKSCFRMYFE